MATNKRQDERHGSGTDAIALLRSDHDGVQRMFDEFETADADRKFELAAEICQALTIHATIEEEIFYPQVREAIDAEDLMLEAEVEHDTARYLIERIQDGEIDELQLSAMIKVLAEYVGHHVSEEQRKMFPRVKRAGLDLEAVGRELLERKQEIEAEIASALAEDAAVEASDAEEDEPGESGRSHRGMAARDDED